MTTHQDQIPPALQAATWSCLGEVDGLVEKWAAHVADIAAYREGLVDLQRVKRDCRLVFVRLLSDMGGHPIPVEALGISERVGHTRALQGLPLADLLTAVRHDYRIMWEAIARHVADDEVREVFDGVPRIWDAIERHSQEVTNAYMATQYGMTQVRKDERRLWFTRVVETDGANHVLNGRACRLLGFTPEAEFTVIAHAERVDGTLNHVYEAIARLGLPVLHFETTAGPVVIAQVDDGAAIPRSVYEVGRRMLYLDRVRGISSVPAAIRVTQGVASVLPETDSSLIKVADHWHSAVFQNPYDTGRLVFQRHLGGLAALPSTDRHLLEHTADVFLETASPGAAARALFCHRNTITYRLDQLEAITGLNIRRPADAALFVLAQHAGRAHHPGSEAPVRAS